MPKALRADALLVLLQLEHSSNFAHLPIQHIRAVHLFRKKKAIEKIVEELAEVRGYNNWSDVIACTVTE